METILEDKKYTFKAVSKKLIVGYRKNGNEYVDYLLVGENVEGKEGLNSVKSVSPIQWTKLDLPDTTTEHSSVHCYGILASGIREKMLFGRFIDLVNSAKSKGIDYRTQPKEFYLFAISL